MNLNKDKKAKRKKYPEPIACSKYTSEEAKKKMIDKHMLSELEK